MSGSGKGGRATAASARVVFLGGVGEVGRNMALVELDGLMLAIDVGLSSSQTSSTCARTPIGSRASS